MIPDLAAQRVALEQIGELATVRFCQSVEALVALVSAGGVDAVVTDLRDSAGASFLSELGPLRRLGPRLPIILHFPPTPAALRDVPDIMAVGRGLYAVLQGCEHLGLTLRPLLHPLRVQSAAETLTRHIVPVVPPPFRPFFLISALKASPRLRVGTAAKWSGITRRRLERALRRARLPGAAEVVGSCTALHAAWWLDVQGWSAKQVLAQMGFSRPISLTRTLQRHCGCSVRSLSDAGGFQGLLYRFESRLVGEAAPPLPA